MNVTTNEEHLHFINFMKLIEESNTSEVLGSFSADHAALFTVSKNLKTNELSLAFQKDGFVFSFWHLKIPTSLQACANGDLYSCVYARGAFTGQNKCGWGKRNQEILVSIRKHTNDLTIWLSEHFQALDGLCAQFEEFQTCWLSSNLKANGNYSQKKCYIALWIICLLCTHNFLDSISISNNSTR